MALKIVKPSDLKKQNIKMIVYGKSGLGKTAFSTSMFHQEQHNKLKTLVLDLEKGTTACSRDDINIIPINNASEFKEALDFVKENQNNYDLLVISSWTKYSEMLYVAAKEVVRREELETGKKNQYRLWGLIDEKFREYYDMLLQLDMHLIIECLEEISEIDGYGIINYPMMKAKQFKQYMPSQSDITAYITIVDGEPQLITEPFPRAFTKNRFRHSHPKINRIKQSDKLWNAENFITYLQNGGSNENSK